MNRGNLQKNQVIRTGIQKNLQYQYHRDHIFHITQHNGYQQQHNQMRTISIPDVPVPVTTPKLKSIHIDNNFHSQHYLQS